MLVLILVVLLVLVLLSLLAVVLIHLCATAFVALGAAHASFIEHIGFVAFAIASPTGFWVSVRIRAV